MSVAMDAWKESLSKPPPVPPDDDQPTREEEKEEIRVVMVEEEGGTKEDARTRARALCASEEARKCDST